LPTCGLPQQQAVSFTDFQPSFPALLSNLDTNGTRIGVLATRAGVTRQAAAQLLREIEKCGYVELKASPDDARATVVRFTAKGRRLLSNIIEIVERLEGEFASAVTSGRV
jgi:DNA-binding MarR family transcriptional regulator